MNPFLALLVPLALVALLYLGSAIFATNQVVGDHPEWRIRHVEPDTYGLSPDPVRFGSRDGIPLAAWWFGTQGERGTVLLVHGSGTNKSAMLPRAAFLVRAGYSVLAIDLRAHGESGGSYLTPGYLEAEDVLGAVDHLVAHGAARPIVVLGHSYGAVAAVEAASRSDEVAAAISDSGFVTATEQMDRTLEVLRADPTIPGVFKAPFALQSLPGLGELTGFVFRLRTGVSLDIAGASVIPAVRRLGQRPLLAIGGADDRLALPEYAQRIYDASSAPGRRLLILEGAKHNTYSAAPRAYEAGVLAFLAELGARACTTEVGAAR